MKIRLFFLYVFEFLRDGFYVGIFLLLPFVARELHLDFFQIGSLQASVNMMPIIMAVPVTAISIRLGGLKMLIYSLILYAATFLSIYFASSYFFLLQVFILIGIAFSFFSVNFSHLSTKFFSKESMGTQLGNLMAVGDVSKAIFSLVTPFIIGLIGWRIMSFSVGVITGVIFLILFWLYRVYMKGKDDEKVELKKAAYPISYKFLLRHKKYIMALLANSLDMGVNTPFYAFLPFLLLQKGVPVFWLGLFTAFYYFGNVCSRLIFGRVIDKMGNAKTFILLEIIMALITVLLVFSPTLVLTAILALLLGFVTEGTDPATLSMIAHSLDKLENTQRAFSISTMTNGISRVLYPLGLGMIANYYGISIAFLVIAISTLIPIIPAALFMKIKD